MENGQGYKKRTAPESNRFFFRDLLSSENVAAFRIQNAWRCFRILKRQRLLDKCREQVSIVVYGCSRGASTAQRLALHRLKNLLATLGLKCQVRDMWKSISYQKEVEVYGGRKALPVVLINGIYIGNHDDLQLLVDCDFLAPILRMEYL